MRLHCYPPLANLAKSQVSLPLACPAPRISSQSSCREIRRRPLDQSASGGAGRECRLHSRELAIWNIRLADAWGMPRQVLAVRVQDREARLCLPGSTSRPRCIRTDCPEPSKPRVPQTRLVNRDFAEKNRLKNRFNFVFSNGEFL